MENNQIGRQHNISFYGKKAIEVDEWMNEQLKKGIYRKRTDLVIDAILCLRHVNQLYGDWRKVGEQPAWVDRLMERLKNVRLDDTQTVEEKEKIIGGVLNLKDDFS